MSIQLKSVNYIYEENTNFAHQALTDVSFEIEQGEFVAVIGHTGSGKSTLMQILNGLLKASSGQVVIMGKDISSGNSKLSQLRKNIGMVFQYPEYQLFEETVYKDVAYGPTKLGLSASEIDSRVKQAMQAVGLGDSELLDKSPFELSGGQKRRVAIAGVLAMQADILILDEPTAGLDPYGKKEILDLIKAEHQKNNTTILLVSHSMDVVAEYVDKILVMNQGRVQFFDKNSEVFKHKAELQAIGLDVPEANKIASSLRAKGIALDEDIFTEKALTEALLNLWGGRSA